MRFSTVLAALLPAGAALAQQTFQIVVGNNSELTFSPSSISNAATGDTIQFIFATKNHTATQSTFADPCTALTTPGQQPIDSGFMPVTAGTTSNFPTYTVQLTNVTAPLWFYCKQTNPANHCEAGMVFAVNPTAAKSFDAFQAAAKALAGTATNATSSAASAPAGASSAAASGAPAASATGLTVPGSAASTGAPAAASGSAASSGSDSSANSSATSAAPGATTSSPADKLHIGAASALIGGLGFIALAL